MINTTQEWKDNIYNSNAEKRIRISVGDTVLTDDDIQGKLEIQETCTNSKDIKIGSCIASNLKFNLTNKGQSIDFLNNEISVEVGLKTGAEFEYIPMGIFRVDEIDDKDERVYKITARDRMKLFDKDCSDFLMSRTYPITLSDLLHQLCVYVGVQLENTSIINGNYQVDDNFATMSITGQQILAWIGEVSASFINVNRYGKLVFKTFTPVTNNITDRDYIDITAAKYTVPKITRVQAGVKEDDLGIIVGTGNITYSIINNPLLYTMSEAQIAPALQNILTRLQTIPVYTPTKLYGKGNPAVETGDIISVSTVKRQAIDILVMDRKFVYQKSFRDTYESFGTQAVGEKRIVQSNIIQLKGKFNILTRTLDENTLRLGDVERGYNEISQTVDGTVSEISDIHGNINEITQDVSNFKVEINNKVEQIELTPGPPGKDGPQGLPGTPGVDGETYYTWIKYADTPVSGMSDDATGKIYMGIAVNKVTPNESTNYSDYTWSLTKGEQGVPGQKGTDGKTTYTWVKYADTPKTGMSDNPTGKLYIGLAFNKMTQTESTNYGDYAWSLMPQNIDIDGIVDGKLTSYYTKTETNSQINQAKDSINLSVDTKISTATTTINRRTDEILKSYSTTQEMNSAIELKGAEIDLSVSKKVLGTYYQSVQPQNPKVGEFWYNPGIDFTVDNLNMTVNEMTMTVDSLVFTPSALKRWNGSKWEEAKDTETSRSIGELNIKAGSIELRVAETEKNLDAVKINMSEIKLTTDSITLRVSETEQGVNDVKNKVTEIKLTTDSITAAVNAAKLTFDDSFGLTIKNGGFRILDNSNVELLKTTGGHLEMLGYLQTGTGQDAVKIDNTGIYFNTNNVWDTRIKRNGTGIMIQSDGSISFNNLFGRSCSWTAININGTFHTFLSGGALVI